MMIEGKFNAPDELYYHKEHTYAKIEDGKVLIGITDFAQHLAGTIKRVVTLEEDDEVQQDKPFGTLSSGKWTGKVYSPVTGTIVEINEDIEDEPKAINDDPYGAGWLVKVEPDDLEGDLGRLLKGGSQEFSDFIAGDIAKKKAEGVYKE